MLPKTKRADKKTIDQVFSAGKYINSPTLTLKYILKNKGTSRISVIVPKSAARLAVKRNRLRRLGYKALQKVLGQWPRGIEGAFIFKKYEDDSIKIEKEIEIILGKIINKDN